MELNVKNECLQVTGITEAFFEYFSHLVRPLYLKNMFIFVFKKFLKSPIQ